MTRDDFDVFGFLRLQGYIMTGQRWRLNPAYTPAQAAAAVAEASGKPLRTSEIETLLMKNGVIAE
jgi:hypothetical protein